MSICRSIAVALVLATGLAGAVQAHELTATGLSERAIIIVGGKGGDVSLNPQPLPPGIANPWIRQGLNPQPLPPGRAPEVRPGFWQGSNPDEMVPGRIY